MAEILCPAYLPEEGEPQPCANPECTEVFCFVYEAIKITATMHAEGKKVRGWWKKNPITNKLEQSDSEIQKNVENTEKRKRRARNN